MKYIVTLMLCLGLFSTSNTFGQEKTKKVVIVKKMVDENGNTTTERQEASGKEADELIKKLKKEGTLDGVDIDIEITEGGDVKDVKKEKLEDITIDKTMKGGKEVTTYKIVTEQDGEKKVMVWTGDGEMPAELAEKLKNVEITTKEINDGKEMRIMIETDDIEEGDEIHETHTIEKKIIKVKHNNKVSLGVMIEDDSQGVVISDVMEGSTAQKSGLRSGDTILKVDNTYVFNTDMLLKALSKFDKGGKTKITYLRDGKEKKTDAIF